MYHEIQLNQTQPSLPLLLGPLWPEVMVPVRVPSLDQIDKFKKYSYSIRDWARKDLKKITTQKI